jgi:redox-sensitive bicupin YhaK (pirin superfamily)
MSNTDPYLKSEIVGLALSEHLHVYPAATFPSINPVHWLHSHFAVGGYSPLRRLSGMLTAHMTEIAPHNGFTWHPHRGLEIFTYVIEGEIYHEDITGGRGVIGAGEVQRMFSGDYIAHQELNISDKPVRVIQIWFVAGIEHRGLAPHYQQIAVELMPTSQQGDGQVREIIGPGGATDAHVAARLTSTTVQSGGTSKVVAPQPGEDLFLYIVNGDGRLDASSADGPIGIYDVLMASPMAPEVHLTAGENGLDFLSFYLPSFMSPN